MIQNPIFQTRHYLIVSEIPLCMLILLILNIAQFPNFYNVQVAQISFWKILYNLNTYASIIATIDSFCLDFGLHHPNS